MTGCVLNRLSGIGFSDESGGRGKVDRDLACLPRSSLKLQERCWSSSGDASGGIGEPDRLGGLLDEGKRQFLMAWRHPFFSPLPMFVDGRERTRVVYGIHAAVPCLLSITPAVVTANTEFYFRHAHRGHLGFSYTEKSAYAWMWAPIVASALSSVM